MVATSWLDLAQGRTPVIGQPAMPLEPEDQWLRQIRMMVLEQHERPVWSNAAEIVELLQAANANAIRWPSIVWAATFFPNPGLPQHSASAGRDFVQELLDAAQGTGIDVIPYVHLGVMHRETFAVHPDWAVRDPEGKPRQWNHLHYNSCLSNPAVIDAYASALAHLVAHYDVPAIYVDGPVWYGQCFCQHCQHAYDQAWGEPLPLHPEWADGSRRRYNALRFSQVEAAMAMLRRTVAEAAPTRRVLIMFNTGMLHSHSRRNGSIPERVMSHAHGCLSTEVHRKAPDELKSQGGNFAGIMETVRLGTSLKRTALCYTPPGPYESLVTHESLDTELFGAMYLALGGTPIIETARSFLFDRTGLPAVRRLFDDMERHQELYFQAASPRRIAVLFSRQTAEFHTGDDIGNIYEQHFSGALQALAHDHQSFVCLYDWHLCEEELDDVDVLVLANTACLGEEQVNLIRQFVERGGGIVATADTSLFQERGEQRDNFGLADVFGLQFAGHAPDGDYGELQYREGDGYREIPEAYLKIGTGAHPVVSGLQPDRLVPVSDAWWVGANARPVPDYVVTITEGAAVLAELFLPAGGAYGEPFRFPLGTPPGVVANQFGQGRAVYIGAGVTQHYLRRGLPDLRKLINNAVDWAAATPRPMRIDASTGIVAHLTQTTSGPVSLLLPGAERILALHLVNYTGPMHEIAAYRIEHVAPVPPLPIEILIPDGDHVIGVTLLHAGSPVPYECAGSTVQVTVTGLELRETVLVHLAKATA